MFLSTVVISEFKEVTRVNLHKPPDENVIVPDNLIVEEVSKTPLNMIPKSAELMSLGLPKDLIFEEGNNNMETDQMEDSVGIPNANNIQDEYGHFETESEEIMEDCKSQNEEGALADSEMANKPPQ
ncbi:hypothetical protein K7X08_029012 [Anisodus acutangulus]|uniref:Uncharacterized protein n=1 Tax=Anisodus acutangulus TaxID=402998 RepID=A0A9Q1QVI8_9SOLA|nr:hypothetical protein K7X08_029012 [Anisodus acutangulus]